MREIQIAQIKSRLSQCSLPVAPIVAQAAEAVRFFRGSDFAVSINQHALLTPPNARRLVEREVG